MSYSGMVAGSRRLILALSAVVTFAAGCGSNSRVTFLVIDTQRNEPLAGAQLRAAPLETNQLPLPVSLENLREASASLRSSAMTDRRGRARLTLSSRLPSLIEVVEVDFDATDVDAPPPAWVFDPREGTVQQVSEYGQPSERGNRISLRLAD